MTELQAVILDRDGVINHDSPEYIKTPQEWHAIDGSLQAIARLTQKKIPVFIASNQSGIARGLFDYKTLHQIHKKLVNELAEFGGRIDGFFFCPTLSGPCRKPKPGMLHDIRSRAQIKLTECPFIGDSMKDIEAAQAAGAKPFLVKTGKGAMTVQSGEVPKSVLIFDDLYAAVDNLLHTRDD